MKAKFRWAALTALLVSTLGFAAVPVELAIDFAAETAAEWGKTKGTELKIDSGVLTLNGTNWDSKAFKSVILTPDLRYKLTGTGRGKVVVRLHVGWSRAFARLDLSGDAFHTGSTEFTTPAGNGKYTLSIQVNSDKGEAEVKNLVFTPVAEPAPKAAPVPGEVRIDFAAEKAAGWGHTRGATFEITGGTAVIDGTDWDSKIFKTVTLQPNRQYLATGTGRGKVIVRLHPGWSKPFCQLNLSGDAFRTDSVKFTTPEGNGKYTLSIQINAPKGRGEVRELAFIPLADDPDKVELDAAKLRANRPDPEIVRGFMVGRFDDQTAKDIRRWGGNMIRLQLFPLRFAQQRKSDWESALPAFLDDVENKVKIARDNGLKVAVDLHQAPVPGVRGDYSELWTHPDLEKNFVRLWTALAERLKPYRETIWGYDLYNEPLDRNQLPNAPKEWRPLAIKLLKAIRAIDPEVWIIYEPGPGGGSFGLNNMYPLPDYRVIYSTHFYTPGEFTHQGILNIAGTDLAKAMEKINIRYPGEINGKQYDKAALDASLKTVDEFVARYPVPYYIGEFSVVRWAPEGSGEQYLRDVMELFEQRGWSWSYHAFREFQGWSLEHDGEYWMPGMPEPVPAGDSERGRIVREFLKKNR